MHAVVVSVELHEDFEQARRRLDEEVLPRISRTPGFVAGYWLAPQDGRGFSMVVFESEEAANQVASMAGSMSDEHRTVRDAEVREVVAHA